MHDGGHSGDFTNDVRRAFVRLTAVDLPAAALGRGWPVSTQSGFERILLDHVLGAPWETVLGAPAARTASDLDLLLAVEIGSRVLDGAACPSELNRRSLALRAPRTGQPSGPCDVCGPTDAAICETEVEALMRRAIAAQAAARRSR